LGDDMDLVARLREFLGKNFRNRFNAPDTGMKEIRGKKNFHPMKQTRDNSFRDFIAAATRGTWCGVNDESGKASSIECREGSGPTFPVCADAS
jgi:hypothetical protein